MGWLGVGGFGGFGGFGQLAGFEVGWLGGGEAGEGAAAVYFWG